MSTVPAHLRFSGKTALFSGLLGLSKFCKISFIFGSHGAFFSLSGAVMPVAGVCGGMGVIGLMSGLSAAYKMFVTGTALSVLLAYHIPSLCAAAYWRGSRVLRIALPVLCMALFIANPATRGAEFYTLLWLLPIFGAFQPRSRVFMTALSSTFTAHAVGTVLWLYLVGGSAAFWLSLLPVVIVERLALAAAMTVLYYVTEKMRSAGFVASIRRIQGGLSRRAAA